MDFNLIALGFFSELEKLAKIEGVSLNRQVPKSQYPGVRAGMAKTLGSMRSYHGTSPIGRRESAGNLGTMRTSGWAQEAMRNAP